MEPNIAWDSLLYGEESLEFIVEVVLRTSIMFVFILIALRSSGKRGVKQLSVFELVIIIGMGSAAGDPMFYKQVGIVPAIFVFTVVIGLYRLVTWLSVRFTKFEHLIEGKPLYLVREGKFAIADFNKEDLSQDEFFAELRNHNIEHLGQVRNALMETSGAISILFYADNEVKPGLPLYPDLYDRRSEKIGKAGLYACAHCGHTQKLSKPGTCANCKNKEWVLAMDTKRIS